MSEPFDEYVDQLVLGIGPFGSTLNFRRTPGQPTALGGTQVPLDVGVIRMSNEHLKVVAYVLKKQIEAAEQNQGVVFPMSYQVLNQIRISPEDWELFWKKD